MKKIGIIFLVLITVALFLTYYYWRQATTLPEWYATNPGQKREDTGKLGAKPAEEALEFTLKTSPEENRKVSTSNAESRKTNTGTKENAKTNNDKGVRVKLNKNELNDLVVSKVSKSVGADKYSQVVKGSNTTIKKGKVETGVVVSVSEIPVNKLEKKQKAALEKAIRAFPALKNKKVYVGIEGKPKVKNGQLMLSNNTKIKLGNLSFTVAELSSRLGISKDSLEKLMSLEVKKLKANES